MLTINSKVGATTWHMRKLILIKPWRPILTSVFTKGLESFRLKHSGSEQKPTRLPGIRRNAVNMLKSVAYKRVEQHMEPPKYKPKRKGLSVASRWKNINGMATSVEPRRSYTAIAAREEKIRKEKIARELSCIMFQPKQCSYGSIPQKEMQVATDNKPVDQLQSAHYPSLQRAQKISSSIINDLMTLDEKTKRLIYSGNKQPIPPAQPTQGNYVSAYACRPDYPKNGARDSKVDLPQHASQSLSNMYTVTAKERTNRNKPIGVYCEKCFSKPTSS